MIRLKRTDRITLKENPNLFGQPLPKEEAIELITKLLANRSKCIGDLHSPPNTTVNKNSNYAVAIDYYKPHLAGICEEVWDKAYRFFAKLFGKGKISKLTSKAEYALGDLKKWQTGAEKFKVFWGERESNPETDLFQSLFLGERPMLVTNSLSSDEESKLQESGFEYVNKGNLDYNNCGIEGGSFVFDRKLLEKVMQGDPDLYSRFKSPEELIAYISASINVLAPENEIREYCLRTGLALGYPKESCKGFADMCTLQRETTMMSQEFGITAIPNCSLPFSIKYFCELAKTSPEPEKKQKVKDIVCLLKKQAVLLLNAYNNLENIASYGVNWMPFGEITQETRDKVDRLCAAFSQSNIKPIFESTFAESVYERRFQDIRKLKSAIRLSS